MDKLLFVFKEIYLYQLCKKSIPDFIRFVLMTNYYTHQGNVDLIGINRELSEAIEEDIIHYELGYYFAVKNQNNEIIGGIKAIEMDKVLLSDFLSNINIRTDIVTLDAPHVWLIGRFVVDSRVFAKNKYLLPYRNSVYKLLMLEVIGLLKNNPQDLLIAEIDTCLLRKFRLLNIVMTQIGKPRLLYGSYASLACIRIKDLMQFYNANSDLTKKMQFYVS